MFWSFVFFDLLNDGWDYVFFRFIFNMGVCVVVDIEGVCIVVVMWYVRDVEVLVKFV